MLGLFPVPPPLQLQSIKKLQLLGAVTLQLAEDY